MKISKSQSLGIETGEVQVFDDVDSGGEMWTKDGARTVSSDVRFKEVFSAVPKIHVGIATLDASKDSNLRITLRAGSVTKGGFSIKLATWDDTRLAKVSVNWMAIGPT